MMFMQDVGVTVWDYVHIGRGRLQVRGVFMELGGYVRHFGRWMVDISDEYGKLYYK